MIINIMIINIIIMMINIIIMMINIIEINNIKISN